MPPPIKSEFAPQTINTKAIKHGAEAGIGVTNEIGNIFDAQRLRYPYALHPKDPLPFMPLAEPDIPYQQEIRNDLAKKLKKMTPIDKFTTLEGYKLGIRYAEEQAKNIATSEKLVAEIMQEA